MRYLPVIAFILLPLAASGAALDKSDKLESLEAGIVCAPPVIGSSPAPGTVAGTTHIIAEEPQFVSRSQRVPAVIGIGFGVKAQAMGSDGISDVKIVITHPPMGDGGTTSQAFVSRINGAGPGTTFYQFDYGYELVLGRWQMRAIKDDQVLYTADFDVVSPAQVPELAEICGFGDLLS